MPRKHIPLANFSRKPTTAAQDAIADADARLEKVGLPTYSELLEALRAHDALSLKVDPEGLFAGLETIRARNLLAALINGA